MSETDKAATRAEAAKSEPVEPEAPAVPAKEGEEEQAPMPPIKDEHDLPATPPLDPTGDTADGRMPHPAVIEHAPEHVAAAQVEKHAAAQRELHGRPPKGTVVLGLEDEKLWAMRRRFDSSVLHTLSPPTNLPRGEPDLRPSTLPNVPFSQDELRSNLERFYALIVVDGAGLAHHMSRLMWWQEGERRRSAAFAVAYFTSCIFNMATPFILLLLVRACSSADALADRGKHVRRSFSLFRHARGTSCSRQQNQKSTRCRTPSRHQKATRRHLWASRPRKLASSFQKQSRPNSTRSR